ncbi:ABC transporter ATP-binding protein [Psychrobacter sp. FDAARGOS_221]|uniref:ABC transporter ATP-binding protein n=1 Tax=Psychrobacter sp. FDAARGOS_221 TaxID=1975705 RepID=UPI000BB56571|nr:ABC transporter ATP-binding protein [Psychrobacter sp. FDAARGOS_221]PNK61633.1 ABC transporter ATP-binding protein [Psychrobacter sp. FDAARGOS_221]
MQQQPAATSADMTASKSPYLVIDQISVSFDQTQVVKALSMSLEQGEIGCLLGFSGCGKTTALRAIAGLEQPVQGRVILNNKVLTDIESNKVNVQVMPAKRDMGMVFQDYALFSHLTVSENIGFGLHRWSKADKAARIKEMLALVELTEHADKRINQLSGGQQQRIALARALAPKPELLLLDEPFSNLDMMLRESLAAKVRDILKQTNTTAILVTHDQHEAFAIADKIGVMHKGKLAQWATPDELYHEPNSPFIAEFIGEGAMIDGVIEQGTIKTALGDIKRYPEPIHSHYQEYDYETYYNTGEVCEYDFANGTQIKVLIRPDDIVHDDSSPQQAIVVGRVFRGANFLYRLRLDNGEEVLSLISSHHDHPIGSSIGFRPLMAHVVLFHGDDLDVTTWHRI